MHSNLFILKPSFDFVFVNIWTRLNLKYIASCFVWKLSVVQQYIRSTADCNHKVNTLNMNTLDNKSWNRMDAFVIPLQTTL